MGNAIAEAKSQTFEATQQPTVRICQDAIRMALLVFFDSAFILAVIYKIEVEVTFEKWGQFLEMSRIGNVQCVVPSSAKYDTVYYIGGFMP